MTWQVPLLFSCYGRAHPDTEDSVELTARQAARRMGVAVHMPLLRRTRVAVNVARPASRSLRTATAKMTQRALEPP